MQFLFKYLDRARRFLVDVYSLQGQNMPIELKHLCGKTKNITNNNCILLQVQFLETYRMMSQKKTFLPLLSLLGRDASSIEPAETMVT
jgi:hypothetical protein